MWISLDWILVPVPKIPHFKGFGKRNLQYKIRICQKRHDTVTITVYVWTVVRILMKQTLSRYFATIILWQKLETMLYPGWLISKWNISITISIWDTLYYVFLKKGEYNAYITREGIIPVEFIWDNVVSRVTRLFPS